MYEVIRPDIKNNFINFTDALLFAAGTSDKADIKQGKNLILTINKPKQKQQKL